jgi:hypothetical protein
MSIEIEGLQLIVPNWNRASPKGISTRLAGYQHPRALVGIDSLLNTTGAAMCLLKNC